uniref:Uncharacterized protein n=1 Tax=Mucochytrium quahogii TaxID=96639 RepID=A0A7S2RW14_9STRA|mmetsp:Transcript_5339/g.8250  ORF Transcript_5339/g.8250 Transcript_5339/m.8250 type:complete len:578 (+) Transcript_5339:320-2053(+)|eukprot:CAMPEP_0203750094 /NCGR_PEP_ID=MMETSP0098-20131031/4385_1 /ASSEMBLY_ACC=CAM_ASM_000208 /TAXON_ID=96639 /ORGANISM=" , Strain NY0313808BC1" /LENGTH=577 /DNA_ID=CAMNT_0050639239 /DNA_START=267 /DNA_END=2000 /DNA_ORIENTATION=+
MRRRLPPRRTPRTTPKPLSLEPISQTPLQDAVPKHVEETTQVDEPEETPKEIIEEFSEPGDVNISAEDVSAEDKKQARPFLDFIKSSYVSLDKDAHIVNREIKQQVESRCTEGELACCFVYFLENIYLEEVSLKLNVGRSLWFSNYAKRCLQLENGLQEGFFFETGQVKTSRRVVRGLGKKRGQSHFFRTRICRGISVKLVELVQAVEPHVDTVGEAAEIVARFYENWRRQEAGSKPQEPTHPESYWPSDEYVFVAPNHFDDEECGQTQNDTSLDLREEDKGGGFIVKRDISYFSTVFETATNESLSSKILDPGIEVLFPAVEDLDEFVSYEQARPQKKMKTLKASRSHEFREWLDGRVASMRLKRYNNKTRNVARKEYQACRDLHDLLQERDASCTVRSQALLMLDSNAPLVSKYADLLAQVIPQKKEEEIHKARCCLVAAEGMSFTRLLLKDVYFLDSLSALGQDHDEVSHVVIFLLAVARVSVRCGLSDSYLGNVVSQVYKGLKHGEKSSFLKQLERGTLIRHLRTRAGYRLGPFEKRVPSLSQLQAADLDELARLLRQAAHELTRLPPQAVLI